jgi:asparagine synthase (glutamine-hydrolysing)
MCGLAGILHFDRSHPVDRDLLLRMTRAVAHRGPDAEGLHVDANVGLGHRRLSILDLSPEANQPMSNRDGSVHIVYNGEVYNFHELRAELQSEGYAFRTRSDTEVILYLYERIGPRFVERLTGMFALAIWDARQQMLVLARDRIGIKPLYYHVGPGHIVFASEMKALLVDPRTPTEIDHGALSDYLHLLSIPDPRSILRNVKKLSPGHLLLVRRGRAEERPYWRIPLPNEPRAISLDEAAREFEERFGAAVHSHLVSDVPVGAFLSGGVDSSAVVAFMDPAARAGMYTFSTTFRGLETFDEGPFARRVADQFGTNHREIDLASEAAQALPKLAWHCDEPFAVSSGLALYFLSKRAREEVKVILTGDGGDEVFAGYTWKHIDFPPVAHRLPEWLHGLMRMAAAVGRRMAPSVDLWRRLESLIMPGERYLRSFTCFQNEDLVGLVNPDIWPYLESAWTNNITQRYFDETHGHEEQTRKLYTDMRSTLVSEMLTKVDRLTMASGLEARVPFLDHHLVEWAFELPARLKMEGSEGKLLVKHALHSRLPRDIIYRAKHGFNVPLGRWLRHELRDLVHDLLSANSVRRRGIFNPGAVTSLVERHQSGNDDIGNRVFVLMMLELWWREVMDGRRTALRQAG